MFTEVSLVSLHLYSLHILPLSNPKQQLIYFLSLFFVCLFCFCVFKNLLSFNLIWKAGKQTDLSSTGLLPYSLKQLGGILQTHRIPVVSLHALCSVSCAFGPSLFPGLPHWISSSARIFILQVRCKAQCFFLDNGVVTHLFPHSVWPLKTCMATRTLLNTHVSGPALWYSR